MAMQCRLHTAEESHATFQQTSLSATLGRSLLLSVFCKQLGLSMTTQQQLSLAHVQYLPSCNPSCALYGWSVGSSFSVDQASVGLVQGHLAV